MSLWEHAFNKGSIPDSFPGWTERELFSLQKAVNSFMATLEPFQVPVIVDCVPEKSVLNMQYVLQCFNANRKVITPNEKEEYETSLCSGS